MPPPLLPLSCSPPFILCIVPYLSVLLHITSSLVALTCVLAAANIGLSFAAAFLAKDTTTSEGKLVDAKTGDTLKTDSTTKRFDINPELNAEYNSRQRRLACTNSETTCPVVNADCTWFEVFEPVCYNSNCQYENTGHFGCTGNDAQDPLLVSGTCPDAIGCDFQDVTAVSNADGLAIVGACQSGGAVTIGREYTAGTVDTQICPAASTSYKPNNSDTKTEVKIGTGPSAIEVKPGTSGNYEIINLPLSPEGGLCTVDGDCETGLTCDTSNGSVCASGGSGGGSGETGETICPVSTDPDCACTLQFDPVCHNSVCQYGNDCIAKCAGLKPNQWASGGCS